MLKVGITGGIGSGKSIVATLFKLLGVPVYNADEAAKNLMNNNAQIKNALLQHFGPAVYENESLNRAWLSSRVFNDPAQLAKLNSIVHPVVIQDAVDWMNSQQSNLVIKEAAIFFESGSNTEMDYMVGVYAPQPLRLKRVQKRDNTNQEAILDRISRQMNEDEKMKLCDYVLYNDEQQLLIPQVIQLHQHLLALATNR
jgi:dephospho-CoA kinase